MVREAARQIEALDNEGLDALGQAWLGYEGGGGHRDSPVEDAHQAAFEHGVACLDLGERALVIAAGHSGKIAAGTPIARGRSSHDWPRWWTSGFAPVRFRHNSLPAWPEIGSMTRHDANSRTHG